MGLFYRAVRGAGCYIFRIFYSHKIYGTENLPEGGALLAANHASFLDPPILAVSAPEQVHFLAKRSLFHWPLFSRVIRSLNSHPIAGSPQDLSSFKTVKSLLAEGQHVVLFPEGLRSPDGKLHPIKTGVALIALTCAKPIVPIYIHGTYEIWPRNRIFPRLWGKTACVFGKAIDSAPYMLLEKKKGKEALAEAVGKAIYELQQKYLSKNE